MMHEGGCCWRAPKYGIPCTNDGIDWYEPPFCDELCWWYPHLPSKEGDGAVIPTRERQQQQQQVDDDDSNEDDDSDDDDSMDIDHDGDQPMSAAEAETDALADACRDAKIAPVFTILPQALPFDQRVKLFHSLLKADKKRMLQTAAS
jgi:hypothetical protein